MGQIGILLKMTKEPKEGHLQSKTHELLSLEHFKILTKFGAKKWPYPVFL